jgi:hypothetical protein
MCTGISHLGPARHRGEMGETSEPDGGLLGLRGLEPACGILIPLRVLPQWLDLEA